MKKRETKTVNEWLNGDSINYLMSTIEVPNDGREEDVFTDEEYYFAEKALDETVEEMRDYEISNYDFEQDKKDEFVMFFQGVWELFEKKLAFKKMTLNYNSEVFS